MLLGETSEERGATASVGEKVGFGKVVDLWHSLGMKSCIEPYPSLVAVPHPSASFRPGGKIRAFLVVGPEYGEPMVAIRGAIRRGEETLHELERSFPRNDSSKPALVALEVGLGQLPPGDYRLDIDLGGREKRVLPFVVEPGDDPPAPLVSGPEEPPAESGSWNFLRAKQYLAIGRNREALAALESAVERARSSRPPGSSSGCSLSDWKSRSALWRASSPGSCDRRFTTSF